MTSISGSITIEAGKLEKAIAEEVNRQVAGAVTDAVRPVLDEVRRLAALAEAEIVGAGEAAKILVAAGATLDVSQAGHLVANLARMGYRFTLVDPEAVTQEVPYVAPRDNGFRSPSGAHPVIRTDVLTTAVDLEAGTKDTSWTSKFE